MVANPLSGRSGVETADVQALALQGYGKLRAAAYLVLELTDGSRARSWLTTLLPDITTGDTRPPAAALNVAFTAPGLRKLGLPHSTISGFSLEFLEGMTSAHRSRLLGDVGAAASDRWSWGAPGRGEVDALLLVFASDDDELDRSLSRHRAGLAQHGVEERAALDTRDIGLGEHFGFRDGLSQPALSGVGRPGPAMHTVEPGEFLLGYLNEHGQYPRSPLVPAGLDPHDQLARPPRGPAAATAPVAPGEEDSHDFGRNGSYLVARTLSQDVEAFWRFADQATRGPDGSGDVAARTALAARMVGRWPSGAPLTTSPDADRPDLAEDNDFGYGRDDLAGTRCPVGAHVRRTNPRDSLPPKPGTPASVDVGKRHRLIRRGRAFGPPIDPGRALAGDSDPGTERGLHFIALCADIARQFEFISHTWMMNPSFAGLLDETDPLLGGHGGRGTSFTVQADPVRRRLPEVPVFVTPRGGGYFFLPGARALRYLAGP
jgi:Dyp-type peroxidase family